MQNSPAPPVNHVGTPGILIWQSHPDISMVYPNPCQLQLCVYHSVMLCCLFVLLHHLFLAEPLVHHPLNCHHLHWRPPEQGSLLSAFQFVCKAPVHVLCLRLGYLFSILPLFYQ